MGKFETVDSRGRPVVVGSLVRIVDLDLELFDYLEPDELEDLRSMIGDQLEVEEVSPSGYVSVTKWFDRGQGRSESHTLSLPPKQVALCVPGADA